MGFFFGVSPVVLRREEFRGGGALGYVFRLEAQELDVNDIGEAHGWVVHGLRNQTRDSWKSVGFENG